LGGSHADRKLSQDPEIKLYREHTATGPEIIILIQCIKLEWFTPSMQIHGGYINIYVHPKSNSVKYKDEMWVKIV
jgi:hypothetical protein